MNEYIYQTVRGGQVHGTFDTCDEAYKDAEFFARDGRMFICKLQKVNEDEYKVVERTFPLFGETITLSHGTDEDVENSFAILKWLRRVNAELIDTEAIQWTADELFDCYGQYPRIMSGEYEIVKKDTSK